MEPASEIRRSCQIHRHLPHKAQPVREIARIKVPDAARVGSKVLRCPFIASASPVEAAQQAPRYSSHGQNDMQPFGLLLLKSRSIRQ